MGTSSCTPKTGHEPARARFSPSPGLDYDHDWDWDSVARLYHSHYHDTPFYVLAIETRASTDALYQGQYSPQLCQNWAKSRCNFSAIPDEDGYILLRCYHIVTIVTGEYWRGTCSNQAQWYGIAADFCSVAEAEAAIDSDYGLLLGRLQYLPHNKLYTAQKPHPLFNLAQYW